MTWKEKKGLIFGWGIGLAIGTCVSYAIWRDDMLTWGVPNGIPTVMGALVGALLGYWLFDRPGEEDLRFTNKVNTVISAGAKGLIVGSAMGTAVAFLVVFPLWYFGIWNLAVSLSIFFMGLSVGGLVGLARSVSTSYQSPDEGESPED